MKEVKVTKSIINERQELAVSLLIKKWDYTKGNFTSDEIFYKLK